MQACERLKSLPLYDAEASRSRKPGDTLYGLPDKPLASNFRITIRPRSRRRAPGNGDPRSTHLPRRRALSGNWNARPKTPDSLGANGYSVRWSYYMCIHSSLRYVDLRDASQLFPTEMSLCGGSIGSESKNRDTTQWATPRIGLDCDKWGGTYCRTLGGGRSENR